MERLHLITIYVLALGSFSIVALANDGFYQGSGSSLVPVENKQMKVLNEILEITPLKTQNCYPVLIPPDAKNKNGEFLGDAQLRLGNRVACPKKRTLNDFLTTKFHAKAIYKVQSLQDQTGVQIGFPVPEWNYSAYDSDGLALFTLPAVAEFHTFIDGREISNLDLTSVPTKSISLGDSEHAPARTAAYLWKLDFKKNKEYELITEYDFGVEYSTDFFDSVESKDGDRRILWFDKRSLAEKTYRIGSPFGTEEISYFLKPIKLWTGGIPDEIKIRIEAPIGVPVQFLIPNTKGLECIDNRAFYYRWNKAYPEEDLSVQYPTDDKFKYAKMTKQYEFHAWYEFVAGRSLREGPKGEYPRIDWTCDLLKEFTSSLPKDATLHSWVKYGNIKCVKKCW